MKQTLVIATIALGFSAPCLAQTGHFNAHEVTPDAAFENIKVQKLDDDEHASTFMIWVKEGVKSHYHAEHTEVVMVLEGTGTMTLGEESFEVKAGSYIFIPKGTHHSVLVTSKEPLKAISIQTPHFEGSDRHFVTEE